MKKQGFTHESTYNETQEWYTPKPIFDALGLEFDLDPCSPGRDVVPWIPAKKHLTIIDNGLTTDWNGLAFVNPPYGMDTPKWMRKLALHGNGIGLVFSRTDTQWFHEYATMADAILFVKGRIQFVRSTMAADYIRGIKPSGAGCGAGSMLLAYGEAAYTALIECDGLGSVFIPQEHSPDWQEPTSRLSEMPRNGEGSIVISVPASATSVPHENAPGNVEQGSGLHKKLKNILLNKNLTEHPY